eukprot:CAMPEP_0176075442 /NCGR_PEP_ID=MMETSP0120_2-20121206/37707_1 /TAXON_ID=160619 /ORGANISM="Kryptoperidinium foliaceum, Strain CCMP 1326" /LENGTH=461 /DNA_ID=CAMNT_0017409147 /DNA_START=41 /DNA_END=1426 /DNA_ORIENTATION=+
MPKDWQLTTRWLLGWSLCLLGSAITANAFDILATSPLTVTSSYPAKHLVDLRGGSDRETDYDDEAGELSGKRRKTALDDLSDLEESSEAEEYDDEQLLDEEEEDELSEEEVDVEYEDHSFVVVEEEEEDSDVPVEEDEEEASMEEEEDEDETPVTMTESSTASTQEALERATAESHNIDEHEGSSAFVDRMELADAYDDSLLASDDSSHPATSGTADGVLEDHEALAAATAVGAGGSDDPDAEIVDVDADTEEEAVLAAEADAAEEDKPEDTSSSNEITKGMRDTLVQELGFTSRDVRVLRPEIAEFLIENNLQKPIEGMPPNWYLPGALEKAQKTKQLLRKASVAIVTAGAVVLVALQGPDADSVQDALKSIPAAIGAALSSKKSKKEEPLIESVAPDTSIATEEEEPAPVVDDAYDHPHSVKPGSTTVPVYESDLDKSALDRFITKIENGIKAFFRIKI